MPIRHLAFFGRSKALGAAHKSSQHQALSPGRAPEVEANKLAKKHEATMGPMPPLLYLHLQFTRMWCRRIQLGSGDRTPEAPLLFG